MNRNLLLRIIPALLCLSLLCGCAAGNNTAGNSETTDAPGTENATPDSGTQPDNTTTVPDGSGDASSGEVEASPIATLTSEELKEWEDYFNNMENNGLLRFPYADPADDPDQLAPYLVWMFYDIGDLGISDDERALLTETDLWLDLDTFRLSRDFMNGYLFDHLNIPAEMTENLLDAAKLGVYLMEYDAWYIAHGDTEYSRYEIDRGEVYEDGSVKLYYANDFLRVMQEGGEMDYIDAAMVITLVPREDGSWYIAAHEIVE